MLRRKRPEGSRRRELQVLQRNEGAERGRVVLACRRRACRWRSPSEANDDDDDDDENHRRGRRRC